MELFGYRRPDGTVGFRNHVLIMPTVSCANEACRVIAQQVQGAVSMVNQGGCGEVAANGKVTKTFLAGLAANPNVYATILIGLGCETNKMEDISRIIREQTNKPLRTLLIQEEGGTLSTAFKAVRMAQELIQEASTCKREPVDISELILGIECGGSDATSGLIANPVMGCASDYIVDMGGTAMFSETPEIIGAEHILAQRCVTPDVGQKILNAVARCENQLKTNVRQGQPSPGNKAGGISTLEEKSLGCIHKGGTRPIMEVADCGQKPTKKGLIYMDTNAFDPLSVTAKVAGGCQIIVFTTGRGNPIGNPIAPVIKVTANSDTFIHMKDNIDMDFSEVLDGGKTLQEMGKEALEEICQVANGKRTKAEIYGFGYSETVMSKPCDYI